MAEAVVCGECGQENSAAQRFCGACGASLARSCAACGASNPPGFRFCGSCGCLLESAVHPRPVAEERRWATVLFADLSGFTNLSERMDPEDVRSLADRCLAKIGEIVDRYGGFVNNVMGDGLMALYGAPVAHEDDPERAVRAALEMQRCAAERAEEFGNLTLRVGVNTGEVMFAPVGPEGRREFTAIGDTTNTAARLQSHAPRGGILVGEETYRATRKTIRYEPVEAIRAKGKEVPVPAWLAVEPLAPPAERPTSTVLMVGRDRERALLESIWQRVVDERRPHLVTILGPAGIGKTRLARELLGAAIGHGARALRGRSLPYSETTGFGAFTQLVKEMAGIFETDASGEARAKLDGCVAKHLPAGEAAEVSSRLALLTGLPTDETVEERAAMFASARRFVEELGRQQPTILMFDDVQWADESLLDLVETLAARARETPVLILTLARPELIDARPHWGGGLAASTTLQLDALSDAEAHELTLGLLAKIPGSERLASQIEHAAGGNPFFIEELAAWLGERAAERAASRETGGATVEALPEMAAWLAERIPTEPIDLPSTMRAMIGARIDALPATERRVILDASVVGSVFWRGALERLSVDRARLADTLESLEARDLVRRERASRIRGDAEYSFKHGLIRDVAYARLPRALRRELHVAVAEFIEQAAGSGGATAAILARHWREAGEEERAVEYLLAAAEQVGRGWAKGEAVALYDEALKLIPSEDASRRRRVRLARAVALQATLHTFYGDVQVRDPEEKSHPG